MGRKREDETRTHTHIPPTHSHEHSLSLSHNLVYLFFHLKVILWLFSQNPSFSYFSENSHCSQTHALTLIHMSTHTRTKSARILTHSRDSRALRIGNTISLNLFIAPRSTLFLFGSVFYFLFWRRKHLCKERNKVKIENLSSLSDE